MTATNLARARLLVGRSRFDLAEVELRQELVRDPNSARAHALLGICLAALNRDREATREAEAAIRLAPDLANGHYALAHVLRKRKQYKRALSAIHEAIRLAPRNPALYALLANIHFNQRHWKEALIAAEQGLEVNPEHENCLNLRAMAMVQLGRLAQAQDTIQTVLRQSPNSALAHSSQGWALLHQGKSQLAEERFREALRINPQLEWARLGLIQALKSRYAWYAAILRLHFWIAQVPRPYRVFGVVCAFAAQFALDAIGRLSLNVGFLLTLLALSLVILAGPLATLLLRRDPFGRFVLSSAETSRSYSILGVFAVVAVILGTVVTDRPMLGLTVMVVTSLVTLFVLTRQSLTGARRIAIRAYALLAGVFEVLVLATKVAQLDGTWPIVGRSHANDGASVVFVLVPLLLGWGLVRVLSSDDLIAYLSTRIGRRY